MYNPPPPNNPGAGNNNYYRQPSSTPGVQQPLQSNYGKAPPLSNYGGPSAPTGSGLPPPPPPIASTGPPQPPMGGQFGGGPPGQYNQPPPNQPGQYGPPPPMPNNPSGINLFKDQHISLTKQDPYLRRLHIGLGWDINQYNPNCPFDLDAVVFMLGPNGMVTSNSDFIFYNNKQSRDGAIFHHGDNLSGMGEGDDEVISVNLLQVSPNITRLVFAVSIHDADMRRQNFSQVPRAFIRVANQETGRNVCRYDLTGEGGMNTALICGEVYRDGPEWKFTAVGKSFPGGLAYLCKIFSVTIG
ncbi:CABP1-related protein [Tieghemostelium lacteum]|uniref:CABP1-related protein n=1 Tax=Tieghemostelium lacteum TaxID=361077 RepID=A0A152A0B4_TIELA|nr:CABP1-related protein [Tieghemostelium lacteum]|eukprot:KYQ99643.1 CABP1-related protein [Tieghemostelium lacteum]